MVKCLDSYLSSVAGPAGKLSLFPLMLCCTLAGLLPWPAVFASVRPSGIHFHPSVSQA